MVGLRELFLVWLRVGTFAFGGGNVALGSIRQEFVERRDWIEEGEFARLWALCSASPGINLLCMAILVGRRLGGRRGVLVSLVGMAVPGAAITLLLAAGFVGVSGTAGVKAAMRGVIPATAGLGLASVVRAGWPLAKEGWAQRGTIRAATVALPVLGFGGLFLGVPPVGLLLGGAAIGAALWWMVR